MGYTVTVAREFEELMPAFLENRRKELSALRAAMSSDDFEGLRLLGDRMKGIGNSYGFARVSSIGKLIEASALGADRTALRVLVDQYADYLAKVRVAFEVATSSRKSRRFPVRRRCTSPPARSGP